MNSYISALVPLALIFCACSSDDSTPTPAPKDAAADVPKSACGDPNTNLTCKTGVASKACDVPNVPFVCPTGSTTWACPAGSIPADQCGCSTSGSSLKAGDACQGGSDMDASSTDQ